MPSTQQNRLLAIGTALGEDALLVRKFAFTEQLGRMFQMEVDLLSDQTALDFNQLIGTTATVRLELSGGETRYFNGCISRLVQSESEGKYGCYRATLVPWTWLLTRTADCRIFQKKTVPDIIEEVFKAHEFKDYKLSLSGSYREWEYCVQYRETDFNFISRLMEQEGIYYFFEHADGVHTLVLADGSSAHSVFAGYESMIYRPPTAHQKERSESVSDWVIEKEVQSGAYALADFNFKTTVAPIVSNASIDRQHPASAFEIYDYPGEFDDRDEGEAYAKVRIQELQARHEVLRAQGTVRGACVGSKFQLEDHPRDDQNGRDYLITAVSCQASAPAYESGQDESPFFSSTFTAMPASEPFRSARVTPKPIIQGPQTAIVVGKKGEEIDSDEYGRVRVQFHWDRYGKVDENSSCWVRVSQAVAGKGWGAMSVPRIGQEVIVEFLEGDPDQPIITGRVYNAKATVPYPLPQNQTISTFKSSTSKGGAGFNEIRFEDKKGEEQIFIHGEKNQDIRIKNDCFEWIGNNRHLVIKKDQLESVENNRHEKVTNDHSEEIGKDRNLTVKGKEAKEVTGSHSFKVTGAVIEEFKDNHSEMVTKDYYLKAENVVIEGATNVTLKVGGTSIALAADGIAMKTDGTVKIECSATLDLKSDAPMTVQSSAITTVKGSLVKIN